MQHFGKASGAKRNSKRGTRVGRVAGRLFAPSLLVGDALLGRLETAANSQICARQSAILSLVRLLYLPI